MVINRENVIEKLKQESERAERERRLGMASANNFSYYLEEYLRSNRYWKEFIASNLLNVYRWIFDGALFGCLIEAITGESVQNYMDRTVFKPLGLTAAYSPKYLPAGTPTKDLLKTIRYRPQAIQEELEDLKVNKKTIDQRIKSLKEELKKLTV